MVLFGFQLSIGVISSVCINPYNYRLDLAGTILIVSLLLLGNIKSIRRLLRLFKEIQERNPKNSEGIVFTGASC